MSKKALILVFPKSDEGEVCVPYQVLKRGGVNCILAGPSNEPVTCSVGITMVPDMSLAEAIKLGPYDAIVMPGGRWAWQALAADRNVRTLLEEQEKSGRCLAAICTGTIVMNIHKIMCGRRMTTYPNVETAMHRDARYILKKDDVVVDRNLITSTGQITTTIWSLKILEYISDYKTAALVAQELLVSY